MFSCTARIRNAVCAVVGGGLLVSMTACGESKPSGEHPRSSPSARVSAKAADAPQYKPVASVCALLPEDVARNYVALPLKFKDEPQGSIPDGVHGRCSWWTNAGPPLPPHNGSIGVDLYWFTPDQAMSVDAAQNAHKTFGLWLTGFTKDASPRPVNATSLPGADEVRSFARAVPGHESCRGGLEARRGNVVLQVVYDHDHADQAATEASVRRLGQYLLSRVTGGA